jgi:hypothetical protein
MVKDHTLLKFAGNINQADQSLSLRLTEGSIREIVRLIPDVWLDEELIFSSRADHREAYVTYLLNRLEQSSIFVEEAIHAYKKLV